MIYAALGEGGSSSGSCVIVCVASWRVTSVAGFTRHRSIGRH